MLSSIYLIIITVVMVWSQSCQDLGQNPPFDYPEQPTPPPLGIDGQIFYMGFEDSYEEYQSLNEATPIGSPGFAVGKIGNAYAGAKDSYLIFNTASFAAPLTNNMTFSFWYKIDANPDRAGILVIAPIQEGAASDAQNNRTSGVRIFRENSGGKQRVKANIGNGTADSWIDGGDKADIDPEGANWKFITLVITDANAKLYIDAEEVASADVVTSWKGCDVMSIGSGSPRFNEWGHLSDNSLIDELRIYNKALTPTEIKAKFEEI